jgi:hypothetical protein
MQLFATDGELARGLGLLTEGWHPLILYPSDVICSWHADPWSYRDQSPVIGTALAFLDGLRQTLGTDGLLVWSLPRLMEDHRYSPSQYWQFRAEFLLEYWKAESHEIGDLLEGCTLAAERRPFVLVYRQGVELWSRPPRPPMRFREDRESIEQDTRDVARQDGTPPSW